MWSSTAFNIYMGQHSTVTAAELAPALRRELLLEALADTRCQTPARSGGRTHDRAGLGAILRALTAGLRLVRG